MRQRVNHYFFLIVILIFLSSLRINAQATEKPNIVFIIFDDLNDYTTTLGGNPQVLTPAISQIEEWGTTFLNAHASAPKCAPSRTSFVTGKDLAYTQIYNNPNCKPFRDYFTPGSGNEEVYTLPEYMKDHGGYFTYGINKIYHCFDTDYDYDSITADPCEKSLSWNKYSLFIDGDDTLVRQVGNDLDGGPKSVAWAQIPDSLEPVMYDYRAIDSATIFMNQYLSGEINTCDKPFFMMIGLRKPHLAWFIPEKYFMADYVDDFYAEPFDIPYNNPVNTYPPNGVVMPPQPDTIYNDYLHLPELGKYFATYDSTDYNMQDEVYDIDPLPEIDPLLTDDDRIALLESTIHANGVMAYMAAVKFLDTQVQRFIDSLQSHPELFSNTIIICASDHGYSLGEKKHWQKGALWETDLRVPLVIADLRNPQQQIVNSSVSLLDLFPTICDLTETPYPVFSDSSDYLDGKSLMPLLENPNLVIEKPSLAAYEEHTDDQCSCFPQYSIRNNRFHYILYTSNNAPGIMDCNAGQSYHEAELYEIGTERETDPNEWHNLIDDEEYQPVINYLQQWLPDSGMYLQKTYLATIQVNSLNCFAEHNDTLNLTFDLFDTNGLTVSPPTGYTYLWTNNLTDDSIYGISVQFLLSSIDETVYSNSNRLLFYLQMINDSTHAVAALDLKYIYLNASNEPFASFNVINGGPFTACIKDYSITGSYTKTWWDFGDGHISYDHVPGPYTYSSPGTFTIIHYVQYGNGNCIVTFTKNITVGNSNQSPDLAVSYYPNPASNTLHIEVPDQIDFASITIYDLLGREKKTIRFMGDGCYFSCSVDVSDLRPGVYIFVLRNEEESYEAPFVVSR